MLSLKNKVVFITGASSGIGRQTALAFAEAKAKVVLAARSEPKLQLLANEIKANGGTALVVKLDVRSISSIHNAVQTALDHFGQIDTLINNAGILIRRTFLEYTETDWDDTLNTNLKGVFFLSQSFARHMIKQKIKGNIINVASVAAVRARKNSLAYGISKAALEHLTRLLAVELAPYKIKVNAISPGVFITNINEEFLKSESGKKLIDGILMKRAGELDELVPHILLLASNLSAYMTGSILRIDGGLSCNELN